MAAEQRKLLEQLMGEQLMGVGASSRSSQLSFTDPKVCRSFLVGTCPHDLFTNTKQDLGPCPKVHSEQLKTEYDNDKEKAKYGYEYDYMRDLQKYIDECNRRIDAAQRRLEKTPDEIRQTNALLKQISDLQKTIQTGLSEILILCESGLVSLALSEYYKLKQHKQAKEERERELKALSDTSGPSGHQKLQVCDVCGAYLSRLDNDRRLADHFYGKMHLGYAQMRITYEGLQRELKGRPLPVHSRQEGGGPAGEDAGGPRGLGGFNEGGYGDGGGGGWGGRGGGGYGGRGFRGGGGGYGRGGGGFRGRGGYGGRW